MNAKQARRLLPQTVVMWDEDPTNLGTVRKILTHGVVIDWANGAIGTFAFELMSSVDLYETKEAAHGDSNGHG